MKEVKGGETKLVNMRGYMAVPCESDGDQQQKVSVNLINSLDLPSTDSPQPNATNTNNWPSLSHFPPTPHGRIPRISHSRIAQSGIHK